MLSRIKKNDLVAVISGKDKGKQGRIIAIDPKDRLIKVKDIALVTRHKKARSQDEKGGIMQEEGFIPVSKVMPVCGSCKKACRVRVKFLEDAKSVRVCHRCAEAL